MNPDRFRSSSIIRASDIGQYCFCSIAWYLQKMGYRPQSKAIKRGKQEHYKLGRRIESFEESMSRSKKLLKIAILFLLIGSAGIVGWLIL